MDNTAITIESISASLKEKREIIMEYLAGKEIKFIAIHHNISHREVTSIVNSNQITRTEVEAQIFSEAVAKENARIIEIKSLMLNFYKDALIEIKNQDEKFTFLKDLRGILDSIDKMHRLNMDRPTDISRKTVINADIVKILDKLETPEDKKRFLLDQLSDNNEKKLDNEKKI